MTRPRSFLAAASVAALLAGCNSSNNGTAVFAPDSFSVVAPSTSVAVNGTARVLSLTVDPQYATEFDLNPGTNPILVDINLTLGVDADQTVNALRVQSAELGLDQTLDGTNATVVEGGSFQLVSTIGQVVATLDDGSFDMIATTSREQVDYIYQTFGSWDQATSATGRDLAFFSAGFDTAAAGVPTSGTMYYEGYATGKFRPALQYGVVLPTVADVFMSVDFGVAQTFTFATTNTRYLYNGSGTPATFMDLSGGGTLSGSAMTGDVRSTTSGSGLVGVVDAQLYGPTADEIGGTYATSSENGNIMFGAFGGAAVAPE